MSIYERKGFVKCWTCKSNGVDRYFRGNAERQFHEKSKHASMYQVENYIKKSKSFDSVSDVSSNLGSSFRNDFGKQTSQIDPYFLPLKNPYEAMGHDIKDAEYNPMINARVGGSDRYLRSNVKEEHNRMYNDFDSRKSATKMMEEDHGRGDLASRLSNRREVLLENQLYAKQQELDETKQHINNIKGVTEAERLQHRKVKKGLENRLRYQKMYIVRLREELQSEKMALKDAQENNNNNNNRVEDLTRQISSCNTQLEAAKKFKMEAKRDKEKFRIENEDMAKRLKRYQQDFEKLVNERNDLVKECKSKNQNEVFQNKLLEAEEFYHKKLKDERLSFAESIEEFTRQYEKLELKCRDCERKLEKSLSDLEAARTELTDSETYRQQDIDKLRNEKESLRVELNAKKMSVQDLERANEVLKSKLAEKEIEVKHADRTNLHCYGDYNYFDFDSLLDGSSRSVEGQRANIRSVGLQSSNEVCKEMLFLEADKSELQKTTAYLEMKVETLEGERNTRKADMNALRSRNDELEELLKRYEEKIDELQRALRGMLTEKANVNRELVELRNDLDSKDIEMSYLKKTIEDLDRYNRIKHNSSENEKLSVFDDEFEPSIEKPVEDFERYNGERDVKSYNKQKGVVGNVGVELNEADIKILSKNKEKLEISCEETNLDINDKINNALKVTGETKAKRIELEARFSGKEARTKQANVTRKEKQSKEMHSKYEKELSHKDDVSEVKNYRQRVSRMEVDSKKSHNGLNVLASENKGLLRALESRESSISLNSDRINEEFRELTEALEKMKQREKKIQSHNYGLKKRLEQEEAMRNTINEQITSISKCLQRHKATEDWGNPDTQDLIMEVGKWQQKFDGLLLACPEAASTMDVIAKKSSEVLQKLEKESKTLQERVDSTTFVIKEKQNELKLLEKRSGNFHELSTIVETRNSEIKAKNKQIEEINERNCKLEEDMRYMQGMIRDLEEKIETLESERDELAQERRITQLRKAYDDKRAFKSEKEKLQINIEKELEKMNDGDKTKETIPDRENCAPEERMLRCDYESDFDICENANDDIDGVRNGGCDGQFNGKEDLSFNVNEDSIIEDCQSEVDESDDFWNIIASEKSGEGLSLSYKSEQWPAFGASKEEGQRCTVDSNTHNY